MSKSDETRTFETEIQLQADPEAVWEALTSPTELARWFPLGAKVDPRKGGVLHLSWGDAFSGTCRIQEWDPPRHLRTSWMEQPAADAPGTGARQEGGSAALIRDDREAATRVAVDYFIEGDKGRTVLRLAHSGFSTSPKWDGEYDGVSRGWTYELRSLRHYLVRHRGTPRHVAWSRRDIGIDAGEAWSRLMSSQGIVREGTLDNPVEGDHYAIVTATGDRLAGRVQVCKKGSDFAGTVDGMNDALFRLGIESCFGAPAAQLWMSTWGVPESDVRALEERFDGLLARLFPAQPGA
jgi:uncharacterized protein YndB with AHSA1/START domain